MTWQVKFNSTKLNGTMQKPNAESSIVSVVLRIWENVNIVKNVLFDVWLNGTGEDP